MKQLWKTCGLKLILVVVLIGLLALVPIGAGAQLGLDPCCAIISAGLQSISGLLSSVVAKPLASIQQIQQQAANFEQQMVYPAAAITNARNLAGQMQGQLRQMIRHSPAAHRTAPRCQRRNNLSRRSCPTIPRNVAQISQKLFRGLWGRNAGLGRPAADARCR